MAITHPNLAYVSGPGFDTATAVSNPIFTAPFEDVNSDYMLEQDYMCLLDNFAALPLNTTHPDYGSFPAYYLTREGPKKDIGGGMVRWTRTYCQVPVQRSEPSSIIYNLIGYAVTALPQIVGRARQNVSVSARIQFDYFLLDEATGDIFDATGASVYTGTPGVLPSSVNIPIIPEQQYFDPSVGAVFAGLQTDGIGYGPDAAVPQINYPVPVPGDSDYPPYLAYPTREVYESWRDQTDTVHIYDPVTDTTTDTGLYEIVAIASQSRTWNGNIVVRETLFIRPQ
jgi:hypothetical protein